MAWLFYIFLTAFACHMSAELISGDIQTDLSAHLQDATIPDEFLYELGFFEQELAMSTLGQLEHSQLEEDHTRHKRSFPITDHVHHSYIFDILPDRIDELFIDGTTHSNVDALHDCEDFYFLPVIEDKLRKKDLFVIFGSNKVSFLTYNSSNYEVANASIPLIPENLKLKADAEIKHIHVVTKKIERYDLDRLLIVVAGDDHGSYIRVFSINAFLPENPDTESIYKKVSSVGIDYGHGQSIQDFSATSGNAISKRCTSQYTTWAAVLVSNSNATSPSIIDVYRIENFSGDYRLSTVWSCSVFHEGVVKVFIKKIFDFVVVFEITSLGSSIKVSYFVEEEKVESPYELTIELENGGFVTDLQFFSYGSRKFVLIANSENGQVIKEVFSRGSGLVFSDFFIVDVPYGNKWVLINIPGCRDETLIYLFYSINGIVEVYVAKFSKTGLEVVKSPGTIPVHYLEPDHGYFTSFGQTVYNDKHEAKEACIKNIACAGVYEMRAKNYVMGFSTDVSHNATQYGYFKKTIQDGADLYALLSNSDPVFSRIFPFTADGQGRILIKLVSGQTVIANIVSHVETLERRIVLENADIYNKLKNLTEIAEEHESVVNKTKDILENRVEPFGNQTILGNNTFTNITVDVITTFDVRAWQTLFENSSLTVEDLKIGIDELEDNITELHNKLENLLEELEDAVFVDEDANITGSKWFQGVVNLTSQLNATSLHVEEIFNTDISKLLNETFRRDDPKIIKGNKIYNSTVDVHDAYVETLNGLNVTEDVVTISGNQTIYGETVIVDNLVIENNVIVNKVNGIDIGDEAVPLASNKTIIGEKNFTQWVRANVINVVEHSLVDQVDLSKLANNVLTIDGNETLIGHITFENTLVVKNDVVVDEINDVDVSELNKTTVRKNVETVITADKIFTNQVFLNNSVSLDGLLNGLNTSDIFTTTQSQVFTATKNFHSVTVNELFVHGRVNHLNIPNDIVTLTTDQTITGNHYFNDGITVLGDIIINGTVDLVDISELEGRAISIRNVTIIEGNITFFRTVKFENLIIQNGRVNDKRFQELFEDIIYDFDTNVSITAEKYFAQDLNCSDGFKVEGTVDGFNIPDDFVDVFSNQNISGHKTFQYIRFLKNIYLKGLIDEVNLTELVESVVTLSTEQEISNTLKFISDIHLTGSLILSENRTVDNIDVSEDLLQRNTGTHQIVRELKEFVSTEFEEVVTTESVVCNHIDGVDISEVYNNRVTLSSNQTIHRPLTFENNTIKYLNVTGKVNGVDLEEFVDDIMSLTKDQWVTGDKNFNGWADNIMEVSTLAITDSLSSAEAICFEHGLESEDCKILELSNGQLLVCDNVIFKELVHTNVITGHVKSEGISGYKLNEVKRDAIKIFNDTIVTGDFTFRETFWITGNITFDNEIDGVDIVKLFLNSIKKNSISQIIGDKNFINGFHIQQNSSIDYVNGYSVPNDTLTVNTDQVIKDVLYTFNNTVEVSPDVVLEKNITVCNQENRHECVSFDLSSFVKYVARIDRNQTITGNITFNNTLIVEGDLIVQGLIDEINLLALFNLSLFIEGKEGVDGLIIDTNKTVVIDNLVVNNLNGKDFSSFINRTLRIDRNETVISSKVFNHLIINGTLKADKLTVDGLINSKNITDINERSIKITENGTIEGILTFVQTVNVTRSVKTDNLNGIDISKDVVTLNTSQEITGSKTLKSVQIDVDLNVTEQVNGYYLPDLFNDTFNIFGTQYITGYKNIHTATFNHLRCMTVNGVNTKDYVTLKTEQVIDSKLTFTNHTSIEFLQVQGLINNVSIDEINDNALFLNKTETVTGNLVFENLTTFWNNVTIAPNKTIDGVDLDVLKEEHEKFKDYVDNSVENVTEKNKEVCLAVNAIHNVIEDSAFFVDYRELPVVSHALPALKYLIYASGVYYGLKKNLECDENDFFKILPKNIHAETFQPFASGHGIPGTINKLIEDKGFLFFHKKGFDSGCDQTTHEGSFIIDTAKNESVKFASNLGTIKHASFIATDLHLFVCFVFGSTSRRPSMHFKVDINDLNSVTAVSPSTQSSTDYSTLFELEGNVYVIEVTQVGVTNLVYVSKYVNDLKDLKNKNIFNMYKFSNLEPVIINSNAYLATYTPKSKVGQGYYKVTTYPQLSTFTLFKFLPHAFSNSSLMPVQSLAIEFNIFKSFSVTLGGTTIYYALFAKDYSVDIYKFEGVACFQLNGVLDLAPRLYADETIVFLTVSSEKIPAIILQTSRDRIFYFDAFTNGYALNDSNLNCHAQ